MDRIRSGDEAVVVALFSYSSDGRRALTALRDMPEGAAVFSGTAIREWPEASPSSN